VLKAAHRLVAAEIGDAASPAPSATGRRSYEGRSLTGGHARRLLRGAWSALREGEQKTKSGWTGTGKLKTFRTIGI